MVLEEYFSLSCLAARIDRYTFSSKNVDQTDANYDDIVIIVNF